MPGTIQVSVLEFKSSSSSSASSSISVKVSIGKRDYQTWDKGEFYFPLTTLRDNLVVTLQDADGNEIARTGVRAMSIVEKGSWDDIFPFEGGGHVHMKLQFILSEEDRNRIRTMRESAMEKNKNTKSASLTESSSILVDQKVSDLTEGASPAPKVRETEVPLPEAYQRVRFEKHETHQPHADVQLKTLSGQEGLSKIQSSGPEFSSKKNPISQKLVDDSLNKSEKQGPLEKTPSSVRKMISAFESNLDQDSSSPRNAPILKLQHDKDGKRGPSKDQNPKTPAETNFKGLQSPFVMRNPQELSSFASRPSEDIRSDKDFVGNEPSLARKKLMYSRNTITESEGKDISRKSIFSSQHEVINMKEQVKLPLDIMSSSTSETTTSKKMHEEHSEINTESALNERSKSVACCEEEHNLFGNLDMWMFPNNTRHLCVTTAGKEVINLLGQTEAKTLRGSELKKDGYLKKKKNHNFFRNLRKSRSDNSPDDASGGFVGQVIKIAIIVGFGVFVLLSRQRAQKKQQDRSKGSHLHYP